MMKKRHGANAKVATGSAVIGAAWYRREQWVRLLEIASDRDTLESTYAEWESNAEKALIDFVRQGAQTRKVDIDVNELLSWCRDKGFPVDAKARAAFTAEKLQERDRNHSSNKGRKEIWAIYLSIFVSVVFSTINLGRSCKQDHRIAEIQYGQNALDYQPRLKIAGRPQITASVKALPPASLDTKAFLKAGAGGKAPAIDLAIEILLVYKLNIINAGNALAKTIGIMTADTTSARDVLREHILRMPSDSMDIRTMDEYFNAELPAGSFDTTHVQFEHAVRFISNNEFTIHIMLLYKNELGQYYDTYYLFHYKVSDVYARLVYDRDQIGILRPPPLQAVQLDSVCTYHNYKEHEKRMLLTKIKVLEKKRKIERKVN